MAEYNSDLPTEDEEPPCKKRCSLPTRFGDFIMDKENDDVSK